VHADAVELVGPNAPAVRHPRLRFGQRSIDYRHYLRELARKPQALRQVACELVPALGAPFSVAWGQLVEDHGPKQAARIFARILQAVEDLGEREVRLRLQAALESGEPLQLALRPTAQVVELEVAALPPGLRDVEVSAASAADFDELLLAGGAR